VAVAQAVVGQQAQQAVEGQRGQVADVQEGLHQGDGAHGPVAAELRGVEQQPAVDGEEVVERQQLGGCGADRCRVIKPEEEEDRDLMVRLLTLMGLGSNWALSGCI